MTISEFECQIRNVTRDANWKNIAVWHTAVAYSYLGNRPLDPQKVRQQLLEDPYSRRSALFAALSPEPNDESANYEPSYVFIGGVRLVFGTDNPEPGTSYLEATQLLDLPQLRKPYSKIAELTRFTVTPEFRGRRNYVINELFKHADAFAREWGVETIFAIAPPSIHDIITRAGLSTKLIGGSLRNDDPECQAIYDTYPRYWGKKPQLYQFIDQ